MSALTEIWIRSGFVPAMPWDKTLVFVAAEDNASDEADRPQAAHKAHGAWTVLIGYLGKAAKNIIRFKRCVAKHTRTLANKDPCFDVQSAWIQQHLKDRLTKQVHGRSQYVVLVFFFIRLFFNLQFPALHMNGRIDLYLYKYYLIRLPFTTKHSRKAESQE